jgi:hypothetical protein
MSGKKGADYNGNVQKPHLSFVWVAVAGLNSPCNGLGGGVAAVL